MPSYPSHAPGGAAVPAATHPPADALAAFGRGTLPPDDLAAVADHVATCPDCCAALREVRDDSFVNLLREVGTPDGAGVRTNASLPDTPPPVVAFPDARSVLADHPQYKLLDRLGEGGMGVVFRAEHKVMGRVVALKVMAPHLTARPAAVARFRQEVKAAARLNHPHIVTAHDAGEAGGLHFLVMEYVEGTSLDRLVARKGPLAVPLACQFARQAAQGLQHAFEKGMVHRDIKPQNLMVTRKGQLKVLDFGLARFARDTSAEPPLGGGAAGAAPPTAATAMNTIMGTPDYLSPEQARCSAVDIRADVYSLGCTLYFLLTGRAPFEGAASVFDKLLAHATEAQPPLSASRLDVPPGLEAVLAKMTAKDAADRYATPAEVAAALAPFARGEGAGAAPHEPVPVAVPVVEAALAPAPATVTVFPRAAEPGPTDVIVTPRPRPEKRRKKSADTKWTPARWVAVGGVVVAVLIGAAVVRSALKRAGSPTTTAAATPEPPARPTPTRPTALGGKKAADPPASPWRGGAVPQVMFVLPVKGLYVPDYAPVRERLEAAGVGVKVAVGAPPPFGGPPGGFQPGLSYPKKEGAFLPPVAADLIFQPDLDLTPIRAVVFVGEDVGEFVGPPKGPGFADKGFAKAPPTAQAAAEVIRRAQAQNVVLGGICTGQLVLAKYGALDGKTVARSPFSEQYGGKWGVAYPSPAFALDAAGVRTDGRVVTAAGPEHAAAFADALLAAIRG